MKTVVYIWLGYFILLFFNDSFYNNTDFFEISNHDNNIIRKLSNISNVTSNHNETSTHHSTTESGGIFGSLSHIDYKIGTASLLITVLAVLIIEQQFLQLHHLTLETAFNAMINKIEKELMIVGCTAFLFKIVAFNTTILTGDWFHALEFAGFFFHLFFF
jgi:hypothetical protein